MKIDDISRIGAVNAYRKNQDSKSPQRTQKKEKIVDQVEISPEAKQLLSAKRPEGGYATDSARLQELKRSIEAGTYRVDPYRLAEKLLPYFKRTGE